MEQFPNSLNSERPYKLLQGEELIDIVVHPPRTYENIPSSLHEMMRLTRANNPNEIGAHGPSIASLAFDVSAQTSVPEGDSPLSDHSELISAPEHLRLYEVVFGRDSLQAAIDLISSHPELARATVLHLASLQGIETVRARQENPGRIVHEARDPNDPIAVEMSRQRGWEWPFYGSVDATPLFVRTIAAYCKSTEENGAFLSETYRDLTNTERTVGYSLSMAVQWILHRLESNPEGLLEYHHLPPEYATSNEWIGAWNEVWKDSWDSYHHADGTMANHEQGIASIEVQSITYDALRDAADLYENIFDLPDQAELLRSKADHLRAAIHQHFWTEEKGGYFVLGTDRDENQQLRQLKLRTSNMGHVLNSTLLEDGEPESERRFEAVLRQVLSPELLNISGIRTLATDEVRYRDGAYHNGSVWPWDTHHIAKGIRRRGDRLVTIPYTTIDGQHHDVISCYDIADDLDRRLLNIIDTVKTFPEYVRGSEDLVPTVNNETITVYDSIFDYVYKAEQPPQEVQAWTVAVILAIKRRINRRNLAKLESS